MPTTHFSVVRLGAVGTSGPSKNCFGCLAVIAWCDQRAVWRDA